LKKKKKKRAQTTFWVFFFLVFRGREISRAGEKKFQVISIFFIDMSWVYRFAPAETAPSKYGVDVVASMDGLAGFDRMIEKSSGEWGNLGRRESGSPRRRRFPIFGAGEL
jgi:hypothetical protein